MSDTPIARRFGALLRAARLSAAPPLNTQQGLADALGVTQQAIGSWEAGRKMPGSETLLNVGRLLELDLNEFAAEAATT